jgi:predicted transcriptional regulator
MPRLFKRHAAPSTLGPLEIAVMEILWDRPAANVHDVAHLLARPLAYTTVMTTLDRLYKKGMLDRRKAERAFLYSASFTRQEWEQRRAGEVLAGFLAGPAPSGELLISCLVDAVGEHDHALLGELEKKIKAKRKELDRRTKS